ncbi:MAG: sulfotransferase, partial [Halioglobus sp.]|nr:sulfotransferase [Halioglobus sp.]
RVFGEASTWYLTLPGMPETLYRYNPAARILILLRNPVDRAFSAWCHARSEDVEPCDNFAEALTLENSRGEVEFLLRYRQMGLYSSALEAYQAVFPAEQLRVMWYDDLRSDPAALWRDACAFLEIDTGFTPPFYRRYNRSGKPRSKIVQSLLKSHRVKSAVRRVMPHQWGLAVKARLDDINLQALPAMQASTREELKAFYREDIAAVATLTGKNLDAWLR